MLVDGIDKVRAYLAVGMPKSINLMIIPIVLIIALFFFDWVSAIIALIALPVVFGFMAMLGVNARNLKTLEVDPDAFGRLVQLVPDDVVKVAESGISGVTDATRYADLGADVVLVGEALVKDGNPTAAVAALRAIGRS